MSNKYINIFNGGSCYSTEELQNYLSGKLPKDKVLEIELHLSNCNMCRDEYEGLTLLKDTKKLPIIINEINTDIDNRIKRDVKARVKPTEYRIKPNARIKRILSVAASIILLIGIGFIVKFYTSDVADKNTAYYAPKMPDSNEDTNRAVEAITTDLDTTVKKINVTTDKASEKNKVTSTIEAKKNLTHKNISNIKNKTITETIKVDDVKKEDFSKDKIKESNVELEADDIALEDKTEKLDKSITLGHSIEVRDEKVVDNDHNLSQNKEEQNKMTTAGKNADIEKKNKKLSVQESLRNIPQNESNVYDGTVRSNNAYFKGANTRGIQSGQNIAVLKIQANNYFQNKRYRKALRTYNKILAIKQDDLSSKLNAGICLFNLRKYNKAIAVLNQIPDSKFKEKALWFSALAHQKEKNKIEAVSNLNKVIEKNGKYLQKAKKMIKEIDK